MNNKRLVILIGLGVVMLTVVGEIFFLTKSAVSNNTIKKDVKGDFKICPQVISSAISPRTGECRNFATPCDVPTDWKQVQKCSAK